MANNKNHKKNLVPFPKGESGNPNGRPKGRKSLATIIRELEEESFNWNLFPKHSKQLQEFIDLAGPIGSPFRAIVYRAVLDSIVGKGIEKVAAREFLRKAGYGDKLDLTSKGERIKQEPIIISAIKPRKANESETIEENETP